MKTIDYSLLRQGFARGYKVLGGLESQVKKINEALPPPVAKSVAHSIRKHFEEILTRVEYVKELESSTGKRKQDELESSPAKRVRWDDTA